MFIPVVEFAKDRQQGREILVRSVVRLQFLDFCLHGTAEIRDSSGCRFVEGSAGIADGEHDAGMIGDQC